MPKELNTSEWRSFFHYVDDYNLEDISEIIFCDNDQCLQGSDINIVLVGKLKDGKFIILTGVEDWPYDPEIEDEVLTIHTRSYVGTNLIALLEEASLSDMKLKIPN